MKYIKFTCSNGYCGCNEDFYEEVEENTDIDGLAQEILINNYSFYDYDYDEYEEDWEAYAENLSVDWEEVTKEEYEENK